MTELELLLYAAVKSAGADGQWCAAIEARMTEADVAALRGLRDSELTEGIKDRAARPLDGVLGVTALIQTPDPVTGKPVHYPVVYSDPE